jgi:hypothetical protein
VIRVTAHALRHLEGRCRKGLVGCHAAKLQRAAALVAAGGGCGGRAEQWEAQTKGIA